LQDANLKLDDAMLQAILKTQRTETTEHVIYGKLAKRHKGKNAEILERISQDEARHASVWKKYTQREVKPSNILIWSMSDALLIIAVFTFFVSVVRSTKFKPMFTEMVTVSFGVAAISFVIGSLANKLLGTPS